jgi:NAD(P)-dependent dehydrogenase (short-subunit alcohol dehydrogenase family)
MVNNAAAGGGPGYLTHEFDKERGINSFRVNVFGTMSLSKALSAHAESKKGSIVNVASIGAELAVPRDSIYAATKGAIRQLTKTMAVEYAASGIRVNAVLPGLTRTGMIPEAVRILRKGYCRKFRWAESPNPWKLPTAFSFWPVTRHLSVPDDHGNGLAGRPATKPPGGVIQQRMRSFQTMLLH